VAYNWTTEWPSVYARHESICPLRNGGECTCTHVTYRSSAKAPDQHSRLLSPEFETALDARDWLRDQRARLTAALALAEEGPLVKTVIADFLAAAERGEAHERSGAEYTQSRLAQLRARLTYVEYELGAMPLQAVRRRHVQALIDQLHRAGLPPDRLVEVVSSFRDVFVYAIQHDLVDFIPIVQLRLPGEDGPLVTTATYATPQTMNGNGHVAATPVPAGRPVAAMMSEQPFDGEPTYGPQMHAEADEPVFEAPPAAVPGPADAAASANPADPPSPAQPDPPPAPGPPDPPPAPGPPDPLDPPVAANSPDWPNPIANTPYAPLPPPPTADAPYAPPPVSTAPYAVPPPSAPLTSPMGTPFADPTAPRPGYPYDPGPMFAAPATQMITPVGAETHYGTPSYGAESVPTQRTVETPRRDDDQGVFLSEQMFWWITRLVVIVFVLIAIVLVAESV
jgi:hypothetical protein